MTRDRELARSYLLVNVATLKVTSVAVATGIPPDMYVVAVGMFVVAVIFGRRGDGNGREGDGEKGGSASQHRISEEWARGRYRTGYLHR